MNTDRNVATLVPVFIDVSKSVTLVSVKFVHCAIVLFQLFYQRTDSDYEQDSP